MPFVTVSDKIEITLIEELDMYCPQCSQQQTSDGMRFCSRCGFPLDGVAKLIAGGGSLPALEEEAGKTLSSPRRRGVQQAVILIFISILLIPLVDVIGSPYHEALIFIFLLAGILRALYALAFQEGKVFKPRKRKESDAASQITANLSSYALPSSQPSTLNFRDPRTRTAEMVESPDSVTENTTKLLDGQDNLNTRRFPEE
ncbi:MAG TPA: zinc ribbon domain-containing protein [Pyrinomonadaceae bacterium]|nr:zinc ribbon domain-containing protein [Pyrinomonadaceae bacterium]